jgi:hypothetical protein
VPCTSGYDGHRDECELTHAVAEDDADHTHGEDRGHDAVPHDDHVDHLHDGHRHAPHGDHHDEQ